MAIVNSNNITTVNDNDNIKTCSIESDINLTKTEVTTNNNTTKENKSLTDKLKDLTKDSKFQKALQDKSNELLSNKDLIDINVTPDTVKLLKDIGLDKIANSVNNTNIPIGKKSRFLAILEELCNNSYNNNLNIDASLLLGLFMALGDLLKCILDMVSLGNKVPDMLLNLAATTVADNSITVLNGLASGKPLDINAASNIVDKTSDLFDKSGINAANILTNNIVINDKKTSIDNKNILANNIVIKDTNTLDINFKINGRKILKDVSSNKTYNNTSTLSDNDIKLIKISI